MLDTDNWGQVDEEQPGFISEIGSFITKHQGPQQLRQWPGAALRLLAGTALEVGSRTTQHRQRPWTTRMLLNEWCRQIRHYLGTHVRTATMYLGPKGDWSTGGAACRGSPPSLSS
jgi:hypothetical protein